MAKRKSYSFLAGAQFSLCFHVQILSGAKPARSESQSTTDFNLLYSCNCNQVRFSHKCSGMEQRVDWHSVRVPTLWRNLLPPSSGESKVLGLLRGLICTASYPLNTGIWNFSVNFLIFSLSILCDLTLLIGLCVSLLGNDVKLVEVSRTDCGKQTF
jgi:hypothetical protein